MQVGFISPISVLDKYCSLTRVQYCLPELFLSSNSYRHYYLSRRQQGDIVVVDSRRIGWRRVPSPIDETLKTVEELAPQYVVMPSYMYDVVRTERAQQEFQEALSKYEERLVYSLEGVTRQSVLQFFRKVRKRGVAPMIAIPSHISRVLRFTPIQAPLITFFYLDNWEDPFETPIREGRQDFLFTSLPIRLGISGRLLTDNKPTPPSLTFQEEDRYPDITIKNVKEVLEYYASESPLRYMSLQR